MGVDIKVKVKKVYRGYEIYAASNFVNGKPTRHETTVPKTFYEAREIVGRYGVMPNEMKGLSDEEKRMIKSSLERKLT